VKSKTKKEECATMAEATTEMTLTTGGNNSKAAAAAAAVMDVEMGNINSSNNTPSTSTGNIPPEPDNIGKGFLKPIPETTPLERVAGERLVLFGFCCSCTYVLVGCDGLLVCKF
jgi:hypothetical protein